MTTLEMTRPDVAVPMRVLSFSDSVKGMGRLQQTLQTGLWAVAEAKEMEGDAFLTETLNQYVAYGCKVAVRLNKTMPSRVWVPPEYVQVDETTYIHPVRAYGEDLVIVDVVQTEEPHPMVAN